MKFALVLITLMICQLSFAQSAREKRIKQEMLDRADKIIEKIDLARADLDKEDVVSACSKVKELFVIYPDHLKGIGTHMDLDRSRTVRSKNDALNELIFIHKQTLICDQGKDSEYVDAKKLRKELKVIGKSVEKQRKIIKKSDTDFENSFYYQYEF